MPEERANQIGSFDDIGQLGMHEVRQFFTRSQWAACHAGRHWFWGWLWHDYLAWRGHVKIFDAGYYR
jgi:hypothetical protein